MKQALKSRNPAPWLGALLVLAAALSLAACDHDIDITAPDIPGPTPVIGSVWVAGTLSTTSEGGSCLEARLIYDGKVIGRSYCKADAAGSCAEMELAGFTEESPGRHTLELQVVRQAPGEVVYTAQAELRLGGPHRPLFQSLGPTSKMLHEGESVTFTFDIP